MCACREGLLLDISELPFELPERNLRNMKYNAKDRQSSPQSRGQHAPVGDSDQNPPWPNLHVRQVLYFLEVSGSYSFSLEGFFFSM